MGECSDGERLYYPSVQVCHATMQRAALLRDWRTRGEYHDGSHRRWSKEPSSEFRFHRDDGVLLTVADYDDGTWDDLVGSQESGGEADKRGDDRDERGE